MSLLRDYNQLVAKGEIEADPAQELVAAHLHKLADELSASSARPKGLQRLLGRPQASTPKGLYIHGGVGRGKTMLMDLFFASLQVEPKRRAHFHEFMASVHDRIAAARQTVPGDPIPVVARQIAKEAKVLCFDELQVNDIADAMILGRLFEGLFRAKVTMVATSNAHPSELYKNGLNRDLFLPFIRLVSAHMDIIELQSAKDFRLEKLAGQQLFFTPLGPRAKAEIDRHWDRLTGRHPGQPQTLHIKGRLLKVPVASMGVARFSFKELCEQPLGANDYLHLAHAFHTIIIEDIPALSRERRDAARRFITLIDSLYDCRVCLVASAEKEPAELYPQGDGADHFARTASRLMEMRSEGYLSKQPLRASGGNA